MTKIDTTQDIKIAKVEKSLEFLVNKHKNLDEKLDKILDQTTKHNSRMAKIEATNFIIRWMLIFSLPIILGIIGFVYGIVINNVEQKIEITKHEVLIEVSTLLEKLEFTGYITE